MVKVKVDGVAEPIPLKASLGSTPLEVIENISDKSLTGSAATMNDVWLEAEDGSMIRYNNIERFVS